MKKGMVITFLGGLVLGGLTLFIIQYFGQSNENKTPFVSMSLVFKECNISAKYQKELKSIEAESNKRLASFENQIRGLKASGGSEETINSMEKELVQMRDVLSEEYQRKSEAFEAIIWENINKKVNEYGKENNLDYIFGANGDGSIMYASDSKDITKEIIEYINK